MKHWQGFAKLLQAFKSVSDWDYWGRPFKAFKSVRIF